MLTEGTLTWPYTSGVADADLGQLSTALQAVAIQTAVEWMWGNSGRVYGTRAAVYRPQARGRGVPGWPGIGLQPVPGAAGALLELGQDDVWTVEDDQTLELPGPVASVESVQINGVPADPSVWRLDGRWLVRQDGSFWPTTQNMIAPLGQPDTWAVMYTRGYPPSQFGQYATAKLIDYFAKQLKSGSPCHLPWNTTTVSRAGVTVTRDANKAVKTSPVPEVDQWIALVNPAGLIAQPRVWSPDLRRNKKPYANSYLATAPPQGVPFGDVASLSDVLVLAPGEPVPAGTPIGTVILRQSP